MATSADNEGAEESSAHPHKSKWDSKTILMVGGTLAAAVAAWLLYKHSSSSSSTAPVAVVTGGSVAGGGGVSPSSGAPQTVRISTTSPTGGSFSYTGPPTGAPPASAYPSPSSSKGTGTPSTSQTKTTTQPNPSVAAATVNYSTLIQMGSGYSVGHTGHLSSGVVQGATGSYYSTEASYTSTLAAIESGQSVAYQSAPGVFTPITSVTQFKKIEPAGPSGGPTDTTTYVKV